MPVTDETTADITPSLDDEHEGRKADKHKKAGEFQKVASDFAEVFSTGFDLTKQAAKVTTESVVKGVQMTEKVVRKTSGTIVQAAKATTDNVTSCTHDITACTPEGRDEAVDAAQVVVEELVATAVDEGMPKADADSAEVDKCEKSLSQSLNPAIKSNGGTNETASVLKDDSNETKGVRQRINNATKRISRGTNKVVSDGTNLVKHGTQKVKDLVVPLHDDSSSHAMSTTAVKGVDLDDSSGSSKEPSSDDDGISTKTVQWAKSTYKKTKKGISKAVQRKGKPRTAKEKALKSTGQSESSMSTILSEEFAVKEDASGVLKIVVTPLMKFLLHDLTIVLFVLVCMAAIPTIRNWTLITNNQIPGSVLFAWLLFAFLAGMEFGRCSGMRRFRVLDSAIQRSKSGTMSESVKSQCKSIPAEIVFDNEQAPPNEGYALVVSLAQRFRKVHVVFQQPQAKMVIDQVDKLRVARQSVWSTLTKDRSAREAWETIGFVKVTDPLMNRLLSNPNFRRKKLKEMMGAQPSEGGESPGEDPVPQPEDSKKIGSFDISKLAAETLENDVIDPSFKLRGMDCFLTDAPEENMLSHPFLLKQGLRDVPTFVVNVMVSWGNILVYFQFPDWFTDFENVIESEDDPQDVIAIKSFLNGDDEYRNKRLKILPCLVDGPLPIRILSPPKRVMTVHCRILPAKWTKHPATVTANGKKLAPCLELDLDLMTNSGMRSMCSLVRRHVSKISLDLAVIVEAPDDRKEDHPEPVACLGLWRFDYLETEGCPPLPDRNAVDDEGDAELEIRRASLLAKQLSVSKLVETRS